MDGQGSWQSAPRGDSPPLPAQGSATTISAASSGNDNDLSPIPRKKQSIHIAIPKKRFDDIGQPTAATAIAKTQQLVFVNSESPFKIKVKLAGVPKDQGGIPARHSPSVSVSRKSKSSRRIQLPTRKNAPSPRGATGSASDDYFSTANRTSTRTPKRKLASYAEKDDQEESDSGFSNNDDLLSRTSSKRSISLSPSPSKRSQRKAAKKMGDEYTDEIDESEFLEPIPSPIGNEASADLVADLNHIEAPPPGTISSLWYSRECVLHVFVVDKILGWKTRPVVKLQYTGNGSAAADDIAVGKKGENKEINSERAAKWSASGVAENMGDSRARMEFSRINPSQCPKVMNIASKKEVRRAKQKGTEPECVARTSAKDREEVVLVKWRGRSYLHCSWERPSDLAALDPTKTTAKSKVRRYFQTQEAAFGWNWKMALEKERSAFHEHGHGSHAREIEREDKYAPTEEEEFFPPDYAEIERILACDENEMNMDVFSKQRALNALAAERDALRLEGSVSSRASSRASSPPDNRKELQEMVEVATITTTSKSDGGVSDDSWDPEDYVRYVVKFKGLPVSESYWEYWLHTKLDSVDETEDFWYRQQPPSPSEVEERLTRKHPKLRDFRKLKESPEFGIRTRRREVAVLNCQSKEALLQDDEVVPDALKLRGYQLEGVNWLLWNWWNKRSCILADEMGLGKTIQSMTFLDRLMKMPQSQVRGPFLIVAPLSLVNQWQSEAAIWTPDFNTILYHGSADARNFLMKQEFYYTDQFTTKAQAIKLRKNNMTKCNVVVTTYEVVLKDAAVLSKIKWRALIVDEAHRLKNAKSRLFQDLGGVPRDFCLLLTGTPLQNSTDELWALLHFADPVSFASREAFIAKFGQLTSQEQVSDLHKILKPYLLRRVKEDVEKSLPPKEETILEVTLTPIQKTYYKAIYEKNTTFLFKGAKSKNAPSLMNAAMELRKCCNHPFLIGGAEERILADAAATPKKDERGPLSTSPHRHVDWRRLTGEQLIASSGKMVLLDKLLPKLKSGGHKVLIFSQMVRVLDLLEDLLRLRDYKFERLDGSRSSSLRTAAVDRFNKPSFNRFVMLLSTRAGGLGLNLVSADTVIIYDSDWNPQNDLQAMARAHRIGQTRAVSVYRLLTSKTYEMHMFNSASMKLGLDRAVLAQQRANEEKSKSKRTDKEKAREIDELLKKGAYDVFREEDDKEAQMFMEETDIDKLLERSSTKVTWGAGGNSLERGLGSFNKASFVASGEGEKEVLDLDDPDFWQKAVGLEAPPDPAFDELTKLMTDGKRQRKQVQQYDPYAVDKAEEAKKQEKIKELEREEAEEKEIQRLTKFLQRQDKSEREKKRKREEAEAKERERLAQVEAKQKKKLQPFGSHLTSRSKENKDKESNSKRARKAERRKALRRAEKEDPVLERIRQAWEVPQRNRATAAALRFGFGRFSKVRQESNLTSLPIQDIEVFVRAYIYQLGLQASISLTDVSVVKGVDLNLGSTLASIYALYGPKDGDWICSAMQSSLAMLEEVEERARFLRMPLVLAEPEYLSELRSGAAIRAMRRFAFMSRVNAIVERALDSILAAVEREGLGRRSCYSFDLKFMDIDLKARHVSTEELLRVVGDYLPCNSSVVHCFNFSPPSIAPWWDRSCDVALIVGTFVHGLGNYEAMRNDEELPFFRKIINFMASDPGSVQAHICFHQATKRAKSVYVEALKTSKRRQQIASHEAVAAVIAANKEEGEGNNASKEQDYVKKEGDKSNAQKNASIGRVDRDIEESKTASSQGADDADTISLSRLSHSIVSAVRSKSKSFIESPFSTTVSAVVPSLDKKKLGCHPHRSLPMPDAIFLDNYLCCLISSIDCPSTHADMLETNIPLADACVERTEENKVRETIAVNIKTAQAGIGGADTLARARSFRGVLCGSDHKRLNDHSDYGLGAASSDLAALATGADSARYKRGPCVPLYLTRYSISSLIYADDDTICRSCDAKQTEDKRKQEKEKEQERKKNLKSEAATFPSKPPAFASTVDESVPSFGGDGGGGGDLGNANQERAIANALVGKEARTTTHANAQSADDVSSNSASDSVYSVSPKLLNNTNWRAGLCVAVLTSGTPLFDDEEFQEASQDVCSAICTSGNIPIAPAFFNCQALVDRASLFAGDVLSVNSVDVQKYITEALLPHCLRLCMEGEAILSADLNRFAVGNAKLRSPIPDPDLPLQEHSEEAVKYASAILRRSKLIRTVRFIIGGGLPLEKVTNTLRGPLLRTSMEGLPLWWCPWIHDLGLLFHVARTGFSGMVNKDNRNEPVHSLCETSCFERGEIDRHTRSVFIEGKDGNPPALPPQLLKVSSKQDIDEWIRIQADQLPSGKALERRVALLCGELSKIIKVSIKDVESNAGSGSTIPERKCYYDDIPLFDLGGWPVS